MQWWEGILGSEGRWRGGGGTKPLSSLKGLGEEKQGESQGPEGTPRGWRAAGELESRHRMREELFQMLQAQVELKVEAPEFLRLGPWLHRSGSPPLWEA